MIPYMDPNPAIVIDILAAVFAITRYAKRCGDAARNSYESGTYYLASCWKQKKERAYFLKSQAIHHLMDEGRLISEGYHKFGDN